MKIRFSWKAAQPPPRLLGIRDTAARSMPSPRVGFGQSTHVVPHFSVQVTPPHNLQLA